MLEDLCAQDQTMAYALGFPKDVTGRIYSMRDAKNWNGDKYRRGATRDVAMWLDEIPSAFRESLNWHRRGATWDVIAWWDDIPSQIRYGVHWINDECLTGLGYELTVIIDVAGKWPAVICPENYDWYTFGPFDMSVKYMKKREQQLQEQVQEMWWQCEPCEPRSNTR